jgi:hypothetical protein
MEKNIAWHMDTCATCAQSKSRTHKLYGKAQSLPTLAKLWTDIFLDLIVGLPKSRCTTKSKKENAIFVVINYLTKNVKYCAVTDMTDAPKLSELPVLKLLIKGAEMPGSIVTNCSLQLTSKFWLIIR